MQNFSIMTVLKNPNFLGGGGGHDRQFPYLGGFELGLTPLAFHVENFM